MSSRRQWTWSAGALVLVAAGAGCASSSSRDAWVYATSRECYFESDGAGELLVDAFTDQPNCVTIGIALVFLALPLALDTVALPVTIPHDVICVLQDTTVAVFGGARRAEGDEGDEAGDGGQGDGALGQAQPAKRRIRDIWAEADEND